MKRFNEWYYKYPDKCDVREWKEKENKNQYYKIQEAWDHQQNIIDQKDAEISLLKKSDARQQATRLAEDLDYSLSIIKVLCGFFCEDHLDAEVGRNWIKKTKQRREE